MSRSGGVRLAAGLLAVLAAGLMVAERDENLRGNRPTAADAVAVPDLTLPRPTDGGAPGRFSDITEAAGVAGPTGWPRITEVPGDRAQAQVDALAAGSARDLVLATSTYLASGGAWGDHDGDGDLDLYLTDPEGPNRLLDNDGTGSFTPSPHADDVAAADQVSGPATFVDVDGDGRLDLHVLGNGSDRLYRNLGDEGFEDVTVASGLDDPGMGQAAAWADVDGDRNLDVYVVNGGCRPCGPDRPVPRAARQPDRLFLSRGDGTFVDASASLDGLAAPTGLGTAAAWLDADDDGDPDLYLVNDTRGQERLPGNALLRNDGPGCGGICFTDLTARSGAGLAGEGHGVGVGDLDGDLVEDLVVTDGGWRTAPTHLLTAVGAGRFRDEAPGRGADVGETAWGAATADLDLDGHLDVVLATGLSERVYDARSDRLGPEVYDDPAALRDALGTVPAEHPVAEDPAPRTDNARLLLQDAEGRFTTELLGSPERVAPIHLGASVGDADGDGRPDLLFGTLGGGYRLLRNETTEGHRTVVRLAAEGRRTTVGARVTVTDDQGRRQVRVHRIDGSASDLLFGFGEARPTRIEVRWPDGQVETLAPEATDRRVTITAASFGGFAATVRSDSLP